MRTGNRSLILLAYATLTAAVASSGVAGEPSARELVALAPVIRSSDKNCKSIDISGFMNKEGITDLKFRAVYRAPDRFALLLYDGLDGTPLLYCSDRNMFVYDPVGPSFLYSGYAGFQIDLLATVETFVFSIDGSVVRSKSSSISIDLQSILWGPGQNGLALMDQAVKDGVVRDEVVKRNEGSYKLVRHEEEGSTIRIDVRLNANPPYTAIDFAEGGAPKPFLGIDKLAINGALKDEMFAFPEKDRLARTMTVRDVAGDGVLKSLGALALVTRAAVVRTAVNHPESRARIKHPELLGVDWERVKQNDKRFSKILKTLVPQGLRTSMPVLPSERESVHERRVKN